MSYPNFEKPQTPQFTSDIEASDLNPSNCIVNEFAFVEITDDGRAIVHLHQRARLVSFRIMAPGAAVVQNVKPETLRAPDLQTNYILAKKLRGFMSGFPGGLVFFFNKFYDVRMLEQNLYANNFDPWVFKKNGWTTQCTRLWTLLASLVEGSGIRFGLIDETTGRTSTTLGSQIKANELSDFDGHQAIPDAINAGFLQKHIEGAVPELASVIEKTSQRTTAKRMLVDADFLICPTVGSGGALPNILTCVGPHPSYPSHLMTVNQVKLSEDGKISDAAVEKISNGCNSGLVKKLKPNAGECFIPSSCRELVEQILSPEEISNARNFAKLIKNDPALKCAIDMGALKKIEKYTDSDFVEGQMVSKGFGSDEDHRALGRFHSAEPPKKLALLEELDDSRYKEFGRRIIYDNWPETLPMQLFRSMRDEFHDQLNTTSSVPWLTIPSALEEIEQLLPDAKPSGAEILRSYKTELLRLRGTPIDPGRET